MIKKTMSNTLSSKSFSIKNNEHINPTAKQFMCKHTELISIDEDEIFSEYDTTELESNDNGLTFYLAIKKDQKFALKTIDKSAIEKVLY